MKCNLNPVESIAISGYVQQKHAAGDIIRLIDRLRQDSLKLYFHKPFAEFLRSIEGIEIHDSEICAGFPAYAQAAISIGGDGTFLRTARWVGNLERPVMGINTGHLGYLASYSLDNIDEISDALTSGSAMVERRSMLSLKCADMPEDIWPFALNEITIHKEETSSMLSINAGINDFPLACYLADGLIVSTPTGSTAYNLAAGGPIVEPSFNCMLITPIAPHSLTLRPLVVAPDTIIRLEISSRSDVMRISLDNRSFTLPIDTNLHIAIAPFHTCIIRRPTDNFAAILREKLLWGQSATRR